MASFDYTDTTLDNKYRILQKIGEGGMGAVYLAQHTIIDKEVAVKFLHSKFSDHPEAVKRFIREAKAAASIRHPNIIDVMDVGASPQGELFMVMEYLEGESLASFLARSGSIDLPAACAILEPTLMALKAAHEQEVVHRDLKTDNVFLAQDSERSWSVKLIDFGVSKIAKLEDEIRLTQSGTVLGTPAYMSPEQARAQDVDQRADLWAVGVILYELLTGDLPFEGEKYNDLLVNILSEEPRSPYELNPLFPAEAEPVVFKALAKDPDERYQSAEEFIEALSEMSSFDKRETHFLSYASAPYEKKVAGGDLGPKVSSAGLSGTPAELIARLSSSPHMTASEWVATAPPQNAKKWAIVALLCTVVLLLGSGLAFLWKTGQLDSQEADTAAAAPAKPVPVVPEHVRITVEGAPVGAHIEFGGAVQSQNPFVVKLSDKLTVVQVKSEGFITYETQVVPSEDKVISAKLLPAPSPQNVELQDKGGDLDPKKKAKSRRRKKRTPKKDSFIQGGRGTEIAEDFE